MTTPRFNFKPTASAPVAGPPSNPALDKAAKAYHNSCLSKAADLEAGYKVGRVKGWADLGIDSIPLTTRAQQFTYQAMKVFLAGWTVSSTTRFKLAEQARKTEVASVSTKFVKAEESSNIRQVGRFKLRPRQRKAIDLCIERLRSGTTNAVVVPLEGGEGKSVIGWALIKHWQENGYFGHAMAKIPYKQALFLTKASVTIDMKVRGRACGVANIDKGVEVMSHTQWATKAMENLFEEEEVVIYNQKITRFIYRMPPPAIIIIDECQEYKKPGSAKSRYLEAVIRKGVEYGSVFVFMSATPWVTVANTWLFAIATGRKWQDEQLSTANFPSLARAIAARAGAAPDENDPKAIGEFRKEFADNYVLPPRDPRTVKAYNDVLLVDFQSEAQRSYYNKTMDRYYDELERIGKGDSEVNKMTVFGKMRHSEEQIKCSVFADLMVKSHAKGHAPVCGVSFQSSVKELVRQLVFVHGVPRSKISVIWGGDQIVTKDIIAKVIGPEIFERIGDLVMRFGRDKSSLSDKEKTAVRKYLKWAKDQAQHDETESSQTLRHAELVQLKLNQQSLPERHVEKERFQNGDTEYCIFTLSAGGVGIDLDHQVEGVRPREAFFTICYWVEEFMQALYRCMRIATLSDVRQHIVFFANTIVANHVAPRLDAKIRSVRAGITAEDDFVDETIDLLVSSRAKAVPTITQSDLRDGSDTVDDTDHGDVDEELRLLMEGNED
jgi:hypothetical protein